VVPGQHQCKVAKDDTDQELVKHCECADETGNTKLRQTFSEKPTASEPLSAKIKELKCSAPSILLPTITAGRSKKKVEQISR
jgi:hypothetical protein